MRFMLIFIVLLSFYPEHTPAEEKKEVEIKNILLQKEEILHYNLLYVDLAFIDETKINELMDSLHQQIATAAIDATYDESFKIIEGKQGSALDRHEFKQRFLEVFYGEGDIQLEVPTKNVEPRVDKALLEEISQKKLGSYTTHYNQGNKERTKNIILSTEAINGTVIFPGDTFSFNKIVGERTKERGYQRAPVIVRGEFSEDIGGGICQVSSTLFNAVDQEGIQMVERYTHSRSVPYVPPGKDATVSWWGPDFSFKNLFNEPIVIRAKASNGNVMVEIVSTETAENFRAN